MPPASKPDAGALGLLTTLAQALQHGAAALRTGHATTALAHFDAALAEAPEDLEAAQLRAQALVELRRLPEALAELRALARARPGDGGVQRLLARLEAIVDEERRREDDERRERERGWAPGGVVDERWEVFGEAHGGMGRVYFVRDRAFGGLELAVKTLAPRPGAAPSETARARAFFLRETRVWLELGAHPHLVSGFYTLEVHGALRFFMEYVPGLPLDEVLRRARGALSLPHALDLALQLCAAVSHVHARGVVHRDLKSANCLVMDDGALRVTDFGLGSYAAEGDDAGAREARASDPPSSRPASDEPDTRPERPGARAAPRASERERERVEAAPAPAPRTSSSLARAYGGAAGTPQYMAPEQWRSLAEAGAAADVYAVGVLLYELCSGQYPFDATPQALARYEPSWPPVLRRAIAAGRPSRELLLWLAHTHLEPLPLRAFRHDAPRELEALALACLAKEPGDRPRIEAVRDALLAVYARVAGEPYARPMPGALEPTRAGANNRAVSLAVMGDAPRARALLDEWLAREPDALYPWLNAQTLVARAGQREPALVAREYLARLRAAHPQAERDDAALRALARLFHRHVPWHREAVEQLAAGPDGALYFTSGDAVLRVSPRDEGSLAREGTSAEREASLPRFAHPAAVSAVAVSHDGAVLATGGYDREVRLFDARDGALLRTLSGHRDRVSALSFSPDGARLASGGGASTHREDRTVRVWNLRAPALAPMVLRGHRGAVTAVAFSPDGARLAVGTALGDVHLWELRDAALLYVFAPPAAPPREGATNPVRALRFARTPAGAGVLCVARGDGALERYDTASGDRLARHEGAEARGAPCLRAAAYDPDDPTGACVAALYDDGALRVWSRVDAEPRATAAGYDEGGALAVALAYVDGALALGGPRGLVRRAGDEAHPRAWPLLIERPRGARGLLHAARERAHLEARLDAGDVRAAAQLQALVASAPELAQDREALVGRVHRAGRRGGVPVAVRAAWCTHALELPGPVQWTSFCDDGRTVLVVVTAPSERGAPSGPLLLRWDIERGVSTPLRLRVAGEGAGEPRALALDAAGRVALVGFDSGAAALLSTTTGRVVRRFEAGAGAVPLTAVALDADGGLALLGDEAGHARLVRARDGTLRARFRAHRRAVAAAAVHPARTAALTGGWDRAARCWALASDGALRSSHDGAALEPLELGAHRAGVTAAGFVSDERRAWSVDDQGVRVWSLLERRALGVLAGFTSGVTCAAVSPGARFVVAGGWDPGVRLFRLRDGRLERVLDGHPFGVTALAFSPGGDALVCGGADGSLRRWLLDAEWLALEDLLAPLEALLDTAAPAGARAREGDDRAAGFDAPSALEALLEAWRDVVRGAARPELEAPLRERVRALRGPVRARLARLAREAGCDASALAASLAQVDPLLAEPAHER